MDDERHDPLGDVINLLATPIATGLRAIDQYRRGVDEMFRAIDNLNRTMENLNETAERVNRLLNDVEEPIRAMSAVPQRVDDLVGIMGEMSRRLSPLVTFAESATGMFGLWPGGGSKDAPAAAPAEKAPPSQEKAAPSKRSSGTSASTRQRGSSDER